MFRNILFPFDGRRACMQAIPWVGDLARYFDAELTLLYVNEGRSPACCNLAKARFEILDRIGGEHCARTPTVRISEGEVDAEIVGFAEANGIDLIVLPARPLGRFRRLWERSVSQSILKAAPCAVWTAARAQDSSLAIAHVLCCPGDEIGAAGAVRSAARLSRRTGADLTLAYAVRPVSEGTTADLAGGRFLSIPAARAHLHALAQQVGAHAAVRAQTGNIVSVVRQSARDLSATLVVADADSAYELVQALPCPVLSGRFVEQPMLVAT